MITVKFKSGNIIDFPSITSFQREGDTLTVMHSGFGMLVKGKINGVEEVYDEKGDKISYRPFRQ